MPVDRIINGGGIPQKNPALNQVYANVMGKPILVPNGDVTSLGSAIFAFFAAGTFKTIEDAQDALCPGYRTIEPDNRRPQPTQDLYALYRNSTLDSDSASRTRWHWRRAAETARNRGRDAEEARCWKRCGLKSSRQISNSFGADWFSTRSATPAGSRERRFGGDQTQRRSLRENDARQIW